MSALITVQILNITLSNLRIFNNSSQTERIISLRHVKNIQLNATQTAKTNTVYMNMRLAHILLQHTDMYMFT